MCAGAGGREDVARDGEGGDSRRRPQGRRGGDRSARGIQAAKRTAELIPLAHPLALTFVGVEVEIDGGAGVVAVTSEARTVGQTGVEMEAMTACAVAAA